MIWVQSLFATFNSDRTVGWSLEYRKSNYQGTNKCFVLLRMPYTYFVSIENGFAGEGSGLSFCPRLRYSSLSGSFIFIVPNDKELTFLSPPRTILSNVMQAGGGIQGNNGLFLLPMEAQRLSYITATWVALSRTEWLGHTQLQGKVRNAASIWGSHVPRWILGALFTENKWKMDLGEQVPSQSLPYSTPCMWTLCS